MSTPLARRTSASSRASNSPKANSIVDLGERAQDEDGRAVFRPPQRLDDAEPIDAAGKQPVENDRVIGTGRGKIQTVAAVFGVIDRMPLFREPFADELDDPPIVFDEQHLHGTRRRMTQQDRAAPPSSIGDEPLAIYIYCAERS